MADSIDQLGDASGLARPTEILAVPNSASIAGKIEAECSTERTRRASWENRYIMGWASRWGHLRMFISDPRGKTARRQGFALVVERVDWVIALVERAREV